MSFTRSDRDLGGRVLRGAAFLAGARLFVRFFSLINLVVLTRLLAPADFGIAALAVTAIGFLQAFSDVKVNNALIAFDDLGQSHLDTAYTLGLIRGLVLAGLLLGGAGPIARFMDAPALEPVLEVMSVILLIDGIKNPAFLVYERNVDFSKEFRRQTLATLVASLAGIAAAFYFRSYWAIVVSSVIERVLQLALSYWRIPYRPKFGLAAWRSFLGFSGWLMLQGMLTQLASMATRVLIGKFLGTEAVGIFVVARQLAELPTHELLAPLRRVLFPALSSIKHDKPRLRAAYRNAQATIFGLALPISLGMTFYAREIILVLFGAKWLPAAIPLEILAPALAIGTLGAATTSLAMALGEVRGLFVRAAIELAIAYPAIYVGIEVAGLAGAALGVAVYMLATTAMNLLFVGRMIGQRLLAPLGASYRSVISAAAMIGGLALVSPPFDAARSTGAQLAQLVALVALGASVYAAFHYALWRLAGRPMGFEENLLHYSGRLARRLTRRRT